MRITIVELESVWRNKPPGLTVHGQSEILRRMPYSTDVTGADPPMHGSF